MTFDLPVSVLGKKNRAGKSRNGNLSHELSDFFF